MNVNQHLLVVLLLFAISASSKAEDDTNYVSTLGLRIKIINEVRSSNPHSLYKVTDNRQKDILFSSMFNFSIKDDPENKMMVSLFKKLLDSIEYEKEICYVLVTTLTRNIEIGQPFYLNNQKELLFPLKEMEPKSYQYVFLRIYKVNKNDDTTDKYILFDNDKTLLESILL